MPRRTVTHTENSVAGNQAIKCMHSVLIDLAINSENRQDRTVTRCPVVIQGIVRVAFLHVQLNKASKCMRKVVMDIAIELEDSLGDSGMAAISGTHY